MVGPPSPSSRVGWRDRSTNSDRPWRHDRRSSERQRAQFAGGAGSFNRYGDYFLSQAFPEGSPTHPAYPTGHGTVAGACITVLKFFFDNDFVIPNPVVPTNDGLSLVPYTGGDAGQLTVRGELNKLANNISFGSWHSRGIHWRSDTSSSIQLGEAVAISMFQDRVATYPEPFTVSLRKIDGSIATISNR